MAFDPFSPVACACFNLRRAARQVTQAYDEALRPAGLQATQFSLLAALAAGEEQDIAMTALAARLGLDRTTLTRNLAVAERAGWVASQPGDDRRERRVTLSAAGLQKLAEALPLWRAAQGRMLKRLGPDGLGALLAALRHAETG